MDFLDNVVKSSNALIKERINNPFGNKQQSTGSTSSNTTLESAANTPNVTNQTFQDSTLDQNLPASSTTTNTTNNNNDDTTEQQENNDDANKKDSQFAAIAADAEMVTQKAVKGAKNIGTFLFSMANKAGQTVTQTAKQVKQAVESTSILTDFTREQQEFIKEHGGSIQAGDLPWADCADDEAKCADMREQILSLSQDKRNFVRAPPNEANFQFDAQQCYPIALSLLKEDPNLGKMRFELVPKLVNEDTFWRNYFYRVSLLKQISDRGGGFANEQAQGWASTRSSSGEGPDEITHTDDTAQLSSTTTTTATTTNVRAHELESSESRKLVAEADDLKSKLKELDIGSFDDGGGLDENDKWEEELQKDLQEFELVSGGDVSALDEEVLNNDIMELKKSAKSNQ